jgi:hypothetical protein
VTEEEKEYSERFYEMERMVSELWKEKVPYDEIKIKYGVLDVCNSLDKKFNLLLKEQNTLYQEFLDSTYQIKDQIALVRSMIAWLLCLTTAIAIFLMYCLSF